MVLIDAHVHFHDCFRFSSFLKAAAKNFRDAATNIGPEDAYQAVLCLTETFDADWFGHLYRRASAASGNQAEGWTIDRTDESCSLKLYGTDGDCLIIIAGRQVVCAERLEVLAIGTDQHFPDGRPIGETLRTVRASDAIPVLPWGFGKWLGKRGTIVRDLIKEGEIFLGDNGGRINCWPSPMEFQNARGRSLAVLPGSDPLPFASQYWRPGSYGFAANAILSESRPAESLRGMLSGNIKIEPYGGRENPVRFIWNQLAMQLRKRSQGNSR